MIAGMKVQFCEETSTFEFVQEFVYHQNRKFVFDRQFVEGAVVDSKTPCAIVLLDEEHG